MEVGEVAEVTFELLDVLEGEVAESALDDLFVLLEFPVEVVVVTGLVSATFVPVCFNVF